MSENKIKKSNENIYRVGDHVFFEMVATAPYQIRRIEELNQGSDGVVVARVAVYYRRCDVAAHLITNLDKKLNAMEAACQQQGQQLNDNNGDSHQINEKCPKKPIPLQQLSLDMQEHVKLCEVFPSTKHEILNATHIRGKCTVVALDEDVEFRAEYANKQNIFYFTRKYDPESKTLRPFGEKIHIGHKWQANVPNLLSDEEKTLDESLKRVTETTMFLCNQLPDNDLQDFLLLTSAVGLYARAHSTQLKDSCLLTTAAQAHRGITKEQAFLLLNQSNYDFHKATSLLVQGGKLRMYWDELEEWNLLEVQSFTQGMQTEGKNLSLIKQKYLPWKSMSDIVAYYYFWKTTNNYVETLQKIAMNKKETKLKQVFIPVYQRVNHSVLYNNKSSNPNAQQSNAAAATVAAGCDTCHATSSPNWYSWQSAGLDYKLCRDCWLYWKRYGGLRGGRGRNDIQVNQKQADKKDTDNVVPITSAANVTAAGASSSPDVVVLNTTSTLLSNSLEVVKQQSLTSFPCPVENCKLVFRTDASLARHVQMVHPANVVQQLTNNSVSSATAVSYFSCLFAIDRLGRRHLMAPLIQKMSRRPMKSISQTISCKDIYESGQKLASTKVASSMDNSTPVSLLMTASVATAGGGGANNGSLVRDSQINNQKGSTISSSSPRILKNATSQKRSYAQFCIDNKTNGENVDENICSLTVSSTKRLAL